MIIRKVIGHHRRERGTKQKERTVENIDQEKLVRRTSDSSGGAASTHS